MLRFVRPPLKSLLLHTFAIAAALLFVGAAQPLSVSYRPYYEVIKMSNLEFGTLVAGTGKDILHTDPRASKFRVRRLDGQARVRLQFILPTHPAEATSGYQLTFDTSSAAWADEDGPAARTTFDPNAPLQLTIPEDGDLYVWIGGKIFLSNTVEGISDPTTIILTVTEN